MYLRRGVNLNDKKIDSDWLITNINSIYLFGNAVKKIFRFSCISIIRWICMRIELSFLTHFILNVSVEYDTRFFLDRSQHFGGFIFFPREYKKRLATYCRTRLVSEEYQASQRSNCFYLSEVWGLPPQWTTTFSPAFLLLLRRICWRWWTSALKPRCNNVVPLTAGTNVRSPWHYLVFFLTHRRGTSPLILWCLCRLQ